MLLMTCVSCRHMPDADTVTQATPKYKPKESILPPAAGEYKVLGVQKGLKSYVIQYDDRFFRGGDIYHDSAAKALNGWGIKTIVSITPSSEERRFCKKYGFTLVEVPFDKSTGPSKENLDLFMKTVETSSDPIYVHCYGGTHRGSMLAIAYRIYVLGWDSDKALVEHGRLGGDLLSDHIMLENILNYKK